ncbi:MAG: orotate phosphoribosyltransferase [Myxococcales bacterium]|nr:orotate phosphoribosyltransferase [Myxococcales bacterium]
MQSHKSELIELMMESGVLTFGDFTTKSGRKTPYFLDAGRYRTGQQLRRLSRIYALAIGEHFGQDYDLLFGPAYKGIPLVVSTAMALAEQGRPDIPFAFNRKESKDHGEGGVLVGQRPRDGDRVLIVEDVTTAGTSIRETVPILCAAANIELAGLIVAVDRKEKGRGPESALSELAREFQMKTHAIVDIDEIVSHLRTRSVDGKPVLDAETLARIESYRALHGAPSD